MAAQIFFPSFIPHANPSNPAALGHWSAQGLWTQSRACGKSHCGLKAWGTVGRGGDPASRLWSQSALVLNKQTLCSCMALRGQDYGRQDYFLLPLSGEPKGALTWASRTPGPGLSVSVSAAFSRRRSLSGPAFAALAVCELL